MEKAKSTKKASCSSQDLRIGIFVIAYNAESHIEETLARIPVDILDRSEVIYVVDDCSTDNTVSKALVLKERYPQLVVLRNRVNQRYGGNQKVGYEFAIEQGLDIVVMLHADGQYAPEVMATLLDPIINGSADLVLGSRMIRRQDARRGGMPLYKYYGNIILTRIQNCLTGAHLYEFHTGYRAYRVSFLKSIPLWENSDEWHFDSEIIMQALASGAQVEEVPIPTYYGDEICHVNGVAYGLHCIFSSLRFWMYKRGLFYSRIYDVDLKGRRYFSKLSDPYSSHAIILRQLERMNMQGKRVLELGVGDACLTEKMAALGAVVDCIEMDPGCVQQAQGHAQRVYVMDLNDSDLTEIEGDYDVILAADIFEHLVYPERIISCLKRFVTPEGFMIVSLPNVANFYVRFNLLAGRFPYHSKGILDRTHLHFYTCRTAVRMLERTGWVCERQYVSAVPVGIVFPFLRKAPFRIVHGLFNMLTRMMKGLMAYQHIGVYRNPNDADLL